MKSLQKEISHETVRPSFQEVRLGLEKESQRVDLEGNLAKSNHPEIFGCRSFHPMIQTDFSETQIEIITPVTSSAKEVLDYLGAIHEVVLRSMDQQEMLWPMSMPPVLPEDDVDIKIADLEKFEDVLYRRYLAKAYGKRKQMVSGIHYNFEFTTEFVEKLFEEQNEFEKIADLKTEIYMKVSRNYLRYRWLITYLFGAAPYSEAGYFTKESGVGPVEPVRSIRNSDFGYTNHDNVFVSYESIEAYAHGISDLVNQGVLSEEKEFYSPVRLRGGKKVADLKEYGVHYIEVRNIDLDPFAPYGITEETIRFLQLFLMYMLWIDNEGCNRDELLRKGTLLNNQVALEHPLEVTSLKEEGVALLEGMLEMAEKIQLSVIDKELIQHAIDLLHHPERTFSGQIVTLKEQGITHHELAVKKGLEYYQQAHEKPYQLAGFREMELSTQLLMFDAIQKGIDVEVLDRADQFLKLKFGKHIEYVKNANMTSKDTYIVPLIMENKTVTKKILGHQGFRVPKGKEFATIDQAVAQYYYFEGKGIVIKPKSTNYGLGISIFKEGATIEDYQTALEIAFKEDSEVLVEEFLSGTEYRFFVLDGEVKAIMLRVPANVVGDGIHSIEELVIKKNQDVLRGTHHRAPLEVIQLGEIEKLMLKEQGYVVNSVPKNKEVVYLRENSNVSTGGDSIDMTDDFDESYKQLAVEAVEALGAKICGIDLIIPDKNQPAFKHSESYGIIEANFNPAMHMHTYPYAGEGRRLTKDVLDFLFPEAIGANICEKEKHDN